MPQNPIIFFLQIIQEFAELNFKGYDDKMFQNILKNNIFLSDDAYKQELEQNNKREFITNILYRIFCKHILEMKTGKNITIREFHLLALELMNSKNIDEFYEILLQYKSTHSFLLRDILYNHLVDI